MLTIKNILKTHRVINFCRSSNENETKMFFSKTKNINLKYEKTSGAVLVGLCQCALHHPHDLDVTCIFARLLQCTEANHDGLF